MQKLTTLCNIQYICCLAADKKFLQRVNSVRFIIAIRRYGDIHPLGRVESYDPHNALCVDPVLIVLKQDFTFELAGYLNDLCQWMVLFFVNVFYCYFSFYHYNASVLKNLTYNLKLSYFPPFNAKSQQFFTNQLKTVFLTKNLLI